MKKRICASLLAASLLLGSTPCAAAASFSDVPDGHWAEAYIQRAVSQGWVQGAEGGLYLPDKTLTGAEFFTMVCNVFFPEQVRASEGSGPMWYDAAWTAALSNGLEDGTNFFSGNDLRNPVSRYDMAQILMNTLSAMGYHLAITGQGVEQMIPDWNTIPGNYQDAVLGMCVMGVLTGKTNGFAGTEGMTRAEAAAVLCRMSDVVGEAAPLPYAAPSSAGSQPQQPEATPAESSGSTSAQELAAEVIRLVNIEREKEGLSPLGTYDSLTAAAEIRAPELADTFSHTRPDGSTCFTALDETGAKTGAYTFGENIAAGGATAAATVEQWMNSDGHRANILNPNFTHIGVGYYYSDGGYRHYWVQMFAGKK